jgi:AAA+ superfamily predicted ATPase
MSAPLPRSLLLADTGPPLLVRLRLRARRHALWMRHLWQQGLTSADQGLAITHGEVDRLLTEPAELAAEQQRFYAGNPEALALREPIALADRIAAQDPDWSELCAAFELGDAEADLLAMAVAVDLDPGFARVYGYLHDEVQASHATPWLAAQLFARPPDAGCGPNSSLIAWRLAAPLDGARNPWSARTPWLADPAIALSMLQGRWHDPALGEAVRVVPAEQVATIECLYPEALAQLRSFVESGDAAAIEIELIGPAGAGKRTLAAQLAATLGRDLVVADGAALLAGQTTEIATGHVVRLARMARAVRGLVYWRHADGIAPAVWKPAQAITGITLFDREAPAGAGADDVMRSTARLDPLSSSARLALWRRLSTMPAPLPVSDRQLNPSEIAAAARAAPLGDAAVRLACRRALQPPSELLQRLPCPYQRADLVLAPDTQRQIDEFEQQARLRWPVYEDWGFGRLVPLGKGITALFAGASGVGKTMSAQVLARTLDLDLYRVDLAGVVNKYIGETEKRLKQVFDFCERAHVMVLFDEADALFGQRTQVKDAHDRFANIEIDYLLQRMEQFNGIAVLATNRKTDLDKAFMRRLRFLVDFLPPGPEERLGLWQRALLPRSPSGEELLDDIDWNFLAGRLTLTGADIKQAALGAAFLARGQGSRIGMGHILACVRREMTKHGVVLRAGLEAK